MTPLAWILLLAATPRVDLVDEIYIIPPHEWRYVELDLKQLPAVVICDYDVEAGPPHVRLALMRRAEMERLRAGEGYSSIAATASGESGHLSQLIQVPGEYVVLVDNRAGPPRAAEVRLRVTLDFSSRGGPTVTYLSPQRRLAVILISFGVFFGIVTWSARRLLGAIRG